MAYNKNELIRKIQSLEELSNDEKSALMELLRTHKKYGLVWENKPEDVEERLRSELPVLQEVKERAIISDDPDAPNHILIEGDNLEALVALTYTHAGEIDVIYIDPPYNTGNKDFIYNDSYVDTEDGYRHSKWLSFMHKRLQIAKHLLSDNGVIFISIDDNEISQLKLLCDEIFGQHNFLQEFIIESNPRGSQASKYFANVHEYLLCYSKASLPNITFGIKKSEENLSEYSNSDNKGAYRLLGLRQRGGAWRRSDRPLLFYPIYVNPETLEVSLEKSNSFLIEVLPKRPTGEESRWTWSKEKVFHESHLLQGVVVNKGTDNEKWDIYRKDYLIGADGEEKVSKVKSIWDEKEINYQNGGTELKEIIGDGLFSYPKPLFLLNKILSCSTKFNSTILDFFAGSGTTLHATMQLNAEDGGHRQCILVTNNENNICEQVTYERNKRVIKGFTSSKGNEVEGLHSNSLRYFRTTFVGRNRTSRGLRELMLASTELLCIKNDLYQRVTEISGKIINKNIAQYFEKDDKRMLIVYQEEAIPSIVELISTMDLSSKMLVYVFSPGNYPYEDEFAEVLDKVELCALPAAIYNAYLKVLPKKKVVYLPEAKEDKSPEAMPAKGSESVSSVEGQLYINFEE